MKIVLTAIIAVAWVAGVAWFNKRPAVQDFSDQNRGFIAAIVPSLVAAALLLLVWQDHLG